MLQLQLYWLGATCAIAFGNAAPTPRVPGGGGGGVVAGDLQMGPGVYGITVGNGGAGGTNVTWRGAQGGASSISALFRKT